MKHIADGIELTKQVYNNTQFLCSLVRALSN